MRTYTVREGAMGPSRKRATKSRHFVITVPAAIGAMIEGREFHCVLTDDGLLYRPVESAPTPTTPAWVKGAG